MSTKPRKIHANSFSERELDAAMEVFHHLLGGRLRQAQDVVRGKAGATLFGKFQRMQQNAKAGVESKLEEPPTS
jgi:hypothetical protein